MLVNKIIFNEFCVQKLYDVNIFLIYFDLFSFIPISLRGSFSGAKRGSVPPVPLKRKWRFFFPFPFSIGSCLAWRNPKGIGVFSSALQGRIIEPSSSETMILWVTI